MMVIDKFATAFLGWEFGIRNDISYEINYDSIRCNWNIELKHGEWKKMLNYSDEQISQDCFLDIFRKDLEMAQKDYERYRDCDDFFKTCLGPKNFEHEKVYIPKENVIYPDLKLKPVKKKKDVVFPDLKPVKEKRNDGTIVILCVAICTIVTIIAFTIMELITLAHMTEILNEINNKELEPVVVEKPVSANYIPQEIKVVINNFEESEWESLGYFKVTAYCPCEKCCGKHATGKTATGTQACEGRTIAVDPKLIPYGTHVLIEGHEYVAEDCGSKVESNHIDLYFDDHDDAMAWGAKYLEVFMLKED